MSDTCQINSALGVFDLIFDLYFLFLTLIVCSALLPLLESWINWMAKLFPEKINHAHTVCFTNVPQSRYKKDFDGCLYGRIAYVQEWCMVFKMTLLQILCSNKPNFAVYGIRGTQWQVLGVQKSGQSILLVCVESRCDLSAWFASIQCYGPIQNSTEEM